MTNVTDTLPALGSITKRWTIRNFEIRQRVIWIAYARNGNTHNPTISYRYDVYQDGDCLMWGVPTLHAAKKYTK